MSRGFKISVISANLIFNAGHLYRITRMFAASELGPIEIISET